MKTCSKRQLLREMAGMGSGRERCWHREVKSCSVSVPPSSQETLKRHRWRCVNINTHKCFMLEPFVSDPEFLLACYNAERRVHGRRQPASLNSKWGLFVASCLLSINWVSENRYSGPTHWCICFIHKATAPSICHDKWCQYYHRLVLDLTHMEHKYWYLLQTDVTVLGEVPCTR